MSIGERLFGRRSVSGRRPRVWVALAFLLSIAVVVLAVIAARAVNEWERSTALLVDQRSEEALTLLTVALNRDMKGVHHSVLASFSEGALNLEKPYELEDLFGQAFARFPYAESFFVWRDDRGRAPSSYVFNRVDRAPAWAPPTPGGRVYPVVSMADPPAMREIIGAVQRLGASGHRFGAFSTTLAGTRSQVVVHLLYHTGGSRTLLGAVGFVVNLHWVEAHYFDDILNQIARIGDVEERIALSVVNERGMLIASTRPRNEKGGVLHERTFPLSFLDAEMLPGSTGDIDAPQWRLSVSAADDRSLVTAARGSARTTWLIVLCGLVAIVGIWLTVRAQQASAELSDMQSEFVASATHDLKTPLALFQLVADTLTKGRYPSEQAIRGYGGMLGEQTQLLERLIDNVLSYASVGHVSQRYRFESLSASSLVEAALERFDARLATTGLEVNVDVPADLPMVKADRVAFLQVLDNVIDNAVKYSPQAKMLSISARALGDRVVISIADQGVGIPSAEREKVFEKFYRGEGALPGGSGLGLAIARRVVEDHGGTIRIVAGVPKGTTVEIALTIHR